MFHVTATGSVAAALNAPFTAMTAITKLKKGKTGADLQGDLNALINAKAPPGAHGGYFGRLVERDEYVLSTGWDSIDVSDILTCTSSRVTHQLISNISEPSLETRSSRRQSRVRLPPSPNVPWFTSPLPRTSSTRDNFGDATNGIITRFRVVVFVSRLA